MLPQTRVPVKELIINFGQGPIVGTVLSAPDRRTGSGPAGHSDLFNLGIGIEKISLAKWFPELLLWRAMQPEYGEGDSANSRQGPLVSSAVSAPDRRTGSGPVGHDGREASRVISKCIEKVSLQFQSLVRGELFNQSIEKLNLADWPSELHPWRSAQPEHGQGESVNGPAEHYFWTEFQQGLASRLSNYSSLLPSPNRLRLRRSWTPPSLDASGSACIVKGRFPPEGSPHVALRTRPEAKRLVRNPGPTMDERGVARPRNGAVCGFNILRHALDKNIDKVSQPARMPNLIFWSYFNQSIVKVSLPAGQQSLTGCNYFNQRGPVGHSELFNLIPASAQRNKTIASFRSPYPQIYFSPQRSRRITSFRWPHR